MPFEIFVAGQPGLEDVLAGELRDLGYAEPRIDAGGVAIDGDWKDVWRINLMSRCAGRVLARIGGFPVFHLAQLDKRAHKFPWADTLAPHVPVKVEVTVKKSKIYHAGAAAQRIERAIAEHTEIDKSAPMRVLARIEDNYCTFSVDTSGAPLHQRDTKTFVGKAPLRETLAASFLRSCGFDGHEPVLDPMCGSGTFLLEAAGIALGRPAGRDRKFAFEHLASFDPATWAGLKGASPEARSEFRAFGSDRDAGAIKGAADNLARAGLDHVCTLDNHSLSDLTRPDTKPGLIMVNPPYGARIGNRKLLFSLYGTLGQVLRERFGGWRLGLVTSDGGLAKSTGLSLSASAPVSFGGLKVRLYQAKL